MATCRHQQLVLVRDTDARVRCRHCHLTIKAQDLVSGYCPECFETSRTRHYDFEDLGPIDPGRVRYRCEECGGMIEA